MWVVVPEWDIAVGAMQKCGTRSLLYSVAKHFTPDLEYEDLRATRFPKSGRFYQTDGRPDFRRIGVVREPVERFASLWRCQIRDGLPGVLPSGLRDPSSVTPEILFEMAHQNTQNPHFAPQAQVLDSADEIIRLEHLQDKWPLPCRLYHKNSTQGTTEISLEIQKQILDCYSRDKAFYEAA